MCGKYHEISVENCRGRYDVARLAKEVKLSRAASVMCICMHYGYGLVADSMIALLHE